MTTKSIHYRDLLGVPFLHLGRTLDGLDCLGLVLEIFAREGIDLEDVVDYPSAKDSREWSASDPFRRHWTRNFRPIERASEPLDIVIVYGGQGVANHIMVMLDKFRLLHCRETIGVAVAHVRELRDYLRWEAFRYDPEA